MLALERAVGASRVCAIECIAGGGAHHNRIWVNRERFDQEAEEGWTDRGKSSRFHQMYRACHIEIRLCQFECKEVGHDACVRKAGHIQTGV